MKHKDVINIVDFKTCGIVQHRALRVPISGVALAPKDWPKKTEFKYGNVVYRISDGFTGLITEVWKYGGTFKYTVKGPTLTYAATEAEIEELRRGNAFLLKRKI